MEVGAQPMGRGRGSEGEGAPIRNTNRDNPRSVQSEIFTNDMGTSCPPRGEGSSPAAQNRLRSRRILFAAKIFYVVWIQKNKKKCRQ